jgi:hypothetical protein
MEFDRMGLYYKDTQMAKLETFSGSPIKYIKNYLGIFKLVLAKILILNIV